MIVSMKKQNGFSAVIVLLSILVVTAIGFTGYYVWNTQQDKKEDTSTTQPAVAGAEETTATTEQTAEQAPQDTQKYLVIEEWGVKIPVDKKYSDLYINKYCVDDRDYCAFIYSPTQITLAKSINGTCYSPADSNNIGRIVRYKNPDGQHLGTTSGLAFPPAKKLGDWYYGFDVPDEATCQYGNANPANNDLSNYYIQFNEDITEYINKIQIL
jgi:Tfp pilus assembly protein PilX